MKAVSDGKPVNIPVLVKERDGGTQEDMLSGDWKFRCKTVGVAWQANPS